MKIKQKQPTLTLIQLNSNNCPRKSSRLSSSCCLECLREFIHSLLGINRPQPSSESSRQYILQIFNRSQRKAARTQKMTELEQETGVTGLFILSKTFIFLLSSHGSLLLSILYVKYSITIVSLSIPISPI